MTDPLPLDSLGREAVRDTMVPVVVCHGRGQDETALTRLTDRLPERVAPVRVCAPHPDGDGYRWYDNTLTNGSHDLSQPRVGEFRESLDRLHEFCAATGDGPVGLLGFSQGAMVGLAALVERPSAYRWVGALHGYLPASHAAEALVARTADVPVFVGYGRKDSAIPSWRSRRAAATLAAGGAVVMESGYDCGHALSDEELSDVASWVDGATELPE